MIIDQLYNSNFYCGMSQRLKKGFDFLLQSNFADLPDGKIHIQGDDVFAIIQTYNTRALTEQSKWESHRRYTDIQLVVEGHERMGYSPLGDLNEVDPYSQENDVILYTAKHGVAYDYPLIKAGMVAVFGPQDAHLPGLLVDQPARVKKVVVKVDMNE